MSQLMVVPELMEAVATDLAAIGSTLQAAHLETAGPTLAMVPAAADEVSIGIAQLFSGQAEEFQKLAGEAVAFHNQFVQQLIAGAGAYVRAEAANVVSLSPLIVAAVPASGAATALGPMIAAVINSVVKDISNIVNTLLGVLLGNLLLLLLLPILLPLALALLNNANVIG